ncbi:MAG: phenylalanine 4-monooxygenase [Saprospiraceae bacterium]|nr:phenylalanine 4-monooxygenase [Saprospiraceae bacterium]
MTHLRLMAIGQNHIFVFPKQIAMRKKPNQQNYADYTPEDFEVWKILYDRQMEHLEGKVANAFLVALDKIGFSNTTIPSFSDVNQRLNRLTGWQLVTVPNISPPKAFFQRLSEKKFTATCWLRKKSELDYLEEPDMFHDVFAHAPLLTNVHYTNFFHQIGVLAMKYINNDEVITKLQRLYWFTIEFGLMRSKGGELGIYGAGIISSKGETEHALSDRSIKHDFDIRRIYQHNFRTDIIQEEYYVIDSFHQLANSIPEFESALFEPAYPD